MECGRDASGRGWHDSRFTHGDNCRHGIVGPKVPRDPDAVDAEVRTTTPPLSRS